jgi:uncharacterized membrane protein YphA (DoxX/SURF4 family)
MGIPLPGLMGFMVTFVELADGILPIVGLLSRLAAVGLAIDLTVALLPVKVDGGLISPKAPALNSTWP